MCGRFTLRSIDRLRAKFANLEWPEGSNLPVFTPRYNIAPSQEVLTVVESRQTRSVEVMTWGLIPSWSSEPTGIINARAETLETKPSFSESFKRRRCLIPADGFYEWRKNGKFKQPHYFQMIDEAPFAFAGLWDEWRDPALRSTPGRRAPVVSCAIVTTSPNELLSTIHDRMPVILPAEDYELWLSEDARVDDLTQLLVPYPADAMKSFPVSDKVNQSKVDDPQLVEAVELREAEQGMLF